MSAGGSGGSGGSGSDGSPLRIGILGTSPAGVGALEIWLEETSTAEVETITTEPTLDSDFLDQFDVLVLQALQDAAGPTNQWTFSAAERSAFEAWVRQGGGVIALSGYTHEPDEALTTNGLVAFSGLQYAGLDGAGDTAEASATACRYTRIHPHRLRTRRSRALP